MAKVDGAGSLLTVGYQGRSLSDLVARLLRHDVRVLIDVREKARSRRPEFNERRLADAVTARGIAYLHLPELGSKTAARRELYETGDFERFAGFYLSYVRRWRLPEVRQLCRLVSVAQWVALRGRVDRASLALASGIVFAVAVIVGVTIADPRSADWQTAHIVAGVVSGAVVAVVYGAVLLWTSRDAQRGASAQMPA